ncbi:MAG: protoheme IX farnesyltransferase [Nitrospirae bacterium]|nr:protoheme IX farnesyltransferase [Nitrospirota bacterium]
MRAHLELCKVRISLFSVFSAVTGFLLASGGLHPQMLPLVAGVLLLSCGSCAMNQYQERAIDALMERTKGRPLPSGRIAPRSALFFSVSLIAAGLVLLLQLNTVVAAALGTFGVLWYNGVYTRLKKSTAFALIPGALVGMIPPAIGWVAAGGVMTDPRLLFLCFFFFMWQVPHFWLLVLRYGDEYTKAGLPALTTLFTRAQLVRLVSQWIFCAAVSCLLISLYGMIHTGATKAFLIGISLWLAGTGIDLMRSHGTGTAHPRTFRMVNLSMFFSMVLLSADSLMG